MSCFQVLLTKVLLTKHHERGPVYESTQEFFNTKPEQQECNIPSGDMRKLSEENSGNLRKSVQQSAQRVVKEYPRDAWKYGIVVLGNVAHYS